MNSSFSFLLSVTGLAIVHLRDSVKSVGFHIHRDELGMATHAVVLSLQDETVGTFKMIVAGTFCGHESREVVAAQTGLVVDGRVRFRVLNLGAGSPGGQTYRQ